MDCHLLDMKKLAEGARDKMLQLRAGRVYGLCVAPSRAAPLTRLTPLRNWRVRGERGRTFLLSWLRVEVLTSLVERMEHPVQASRDSRIAT